MRAVLSILNFLLGGFFTSLAWFFATLISIVLIFTLPLTQSCWGITKLSLFPDGNEAVHIDEVEPEGKNAVLSAGGPFLNIFLFWFILFGWWLCISHIASGIVQCLTIIGIPVGIAKFKLAVVALWPVDPHVVSIEEAQAIRERNVRRCYR